MIRRIEDSEKEPEKSDYRQMFELAINDPALAEFDNPDKNVEDLTKEAKRAVCFLARAIGSCRIYGIKLDGLESALTPTMAMAAAEFLFESINRTREMLKEVIKKGRGSTEVDSMEFNEHCIQIVESRLEDWTAEIPLEEAFVGELDEGADDKSALKEFWMEVLDARNHLDEEMKKHPEIFEAAQHTHLLHNWCEGRVKPYDIDCPWFIEGETE